MSTWSVTKQFRVLNGDFNREAQSNLTKQGVRLAPDPACYVYMATVEAEASAEAGMIGDQRLLAIIAPYGIHARVYASGVVEVVE